MNTGAKLAIAGVGTVVLVGIIYAVMKSSRNATAATLPPAVTPQPVVAPSAAKTNIINTSNISKPAAAPIVNNIDNGVHEAVKTYPNESGLRAYRDIV
jgi:hypothetical protein